MESGGAASPQLGVEQALNSRGVPFVRAKVGDRYVLEELVARDWLLGGEGSGHLLALDKHTTGDGIVSALQVLQAVRLGELVEVVMHRVGIGVVRDEELLEFAERALWFKLRRDVKFDAVAGGEQHAAARGQYRRHHDAGVGHQRDAGLLQIAPPTGAVHGREGE